jgi:tryptophan synthase alpha chain
VSRIDEIFARGKAFIPFVVAGDPDLETTHDVLRGLARAGADAIELGVPFSDPIADGPVIQRAADRALARGTTLARTLALAADFRARSSVPLVVFTYLNPLLALAARGAAARDALARAADAVLIVDLPFDEADAPDLVPEGVARIHLAAPSTKEERLRALARPEAPFVYYVSRYGTTGARAELPPELDERVARVRALTGRPVAVGFGVSTAEQAAAVARVADAVVVGSAIVERIERAGAARAAAEAEALARSLAAAVHGARAQG